MAVRLFPFSRPRGTGGFVVGEVLRISCPSARARVVAVTREHVVLDWPWGQADPDSARVRWNGTSALPREADSPESRNTPWRIEGDDVRSLDARSLDARSLGVGDECAVAIPPARFRVRAVRAHRPPADFGRLPRPTVTVGLVFVGDERDRAAGFELHLPCPEPLMIERISLH